MFGGASSAFSIKNSSGTGSLQRNYFDSRLAASSSRRSDVKMKAFKVTFVTPDGEHELVCADDVYVLEVAEDAGLDLPYSCKAGACSTCAGKVVSGTID